MPGLGGIPRRQRLLRGEDIPAAMARIAVVADLELATADADLVSESVFERLDIKRDVHRKLDKTCPAKTILTTNSSYLLLSEFEDVVQRGDRFAALHSYMASPLVDIVGGPRTSAPPSISWSAMCSVSMQCLWC